MIPTWISDQYQDCDLIKLKCKGNDYFKKEKYHLALPYYLAILHRTQHANKNSNLKVDAYNNVSLIYFKIKEYYKCIDKCNIVLSIDPTNKKAKYRKKKCELKIKSQNTQQIDDDFKNDDKSKKYTKIGEVINKKLLNKMGIIDSPLYEVRELLFDLNKYSFFAKKDISKGTILLKERPMFTKANHSHNSFHFANGRVIKTNNSDDLLKNILNNLPQKEQNIFKMMRSSDIAHSSNHNIYSTNNIFIDIDNKYGAIFPTVCRLNHCCVSNTNGYFNTTTKKYYVIACCDIKKGEEICASFVGWIPMNRKERRDKLLKVYGFICECKYCDYKTYNKYEAYMVEFKSLRIKLFDIMRNSIQIKSPFSILDRIIFILKTYLNSNAYYLDDYTEHALICANAKKNVTRLTKYVTEHTYWYNIKHGCIIDNGKKQYQHKFKFPETLTNDFFQYPASVQAAIKFVIDNKRIP